MYLNPKSAPHPIVRHLGSRNPTIAEALAPCLDWDRADYRWPNPVAQWRHERAIACRVEITGRVSLLRDGGWWRRGVLHWISDGESNATSPALILVQFDGQPVSGLRPT